MTRSWWDNEEILGRFRRWLTQTEEEIEALREPAAREAPAQGAASHEAVAEEGGAEGGAAEFDRDAQAGEPLPELPEVGLLQLIEAFTALRHELKLQTKGTRNLEGSVERSLQGLQSAQQAFQSVRAREQEAAERAALPIIEALVGLDEGLLRAGQAFQATHDQMTQSAPTRLRENLDEQFARQPWWRRMLWRRWHEQMRNTACETLGRSTAEEFGSLMDGFRLIQSRLAHALARHGIHRVDEAGVPVDPARMTVVEVVADSDLPPESVVEVIRPGYCWGEQVVRFAEVRAVRSSALRGSGEQDDQDGKDEQGEREEIYNGAEYDPPDRAPAYASQTQSRNEGTQA